MDDLTFSQRYGYEPAKKILQTNSIDAELKNRLWNVFSIEIFNKLQNDDIFASEKSKLLSDFCNNLWHNFYKKDIDNIPYYRSDCKKIISKHFFESKWNKVYNFLEFLVTLNINSDIFIKEVNKVLEEENFAFRFIGKSIAPISNGIEIEEIEDVLKKTKSFTAFKGANEHLTTALERFSDKSKPDYRNCIKEAISAVEAICKHFTKEDTLGVALKKLESKGLVINPVLKQGFEKIYGYTNGKDGIRHALLEDGVIPDFNDAKFMLVACSAFVNYLIAKSGEIIK
ncbi:MAG: hypothetical protein LBP40_07275 [Campylobacteraceae bacterium]|jgi:hypothetical protein|nr:hypothetical protein [Campylobacteraceae bacterium]